MEGTRKFLVDKVNEFAKLRGGGGDLQPTKESIANFFQKILEYDLLRTFDPVRGFFAQIFDGISWGSFVEKLDSIRGLSVEKLSPFLPDSETQLHHWLRVGLTLFLPIALLLLLLYHCAFSRCPRRCFPRGCCCGMVGRGTGKMMKAPGRMGATMPRAPFEANPLGYFRALHAGRPHLS